MCLVERVGVSFAETHGGIIMDLDNHGFMIRRHCLFHGVTVPLRAQVLAHHVALFTRCRELKAKMMGKKALDAAQVCVCVCARARVCVRACCVCVLCVCVLRVWLYVCDCVCARVI